MLKFVVLAACLGLSLAQVPGFGKCPTVPAQKTFDLNKYLGSWYEIYKFPAIFELGKCVRANYTLKEDGHINVDNRQLENGKENHAIGDAYCPDESQPANLLVRFASSAPYGAYNVIDTDYETYTLIYSCGPLLGSLAHVEFAWILARDMNVGQDVTDRLINELKDYGVDVNKFTKTDQEGCPP